VLAVAHEAPQIVGYMQSIGERLEEARKRKGISLREASEATKIRSDFLGYIEQSKFDFDLPEIYKRGFIGNYARYLKLDPEKILTDYNAEQLGSTRSKKAGAEWFGKMELKSAAQEQAEIEEGVDNATYGHISSKAAASESEVAVSNESDEEGDKLFYLKAGLVFVGTLALVFILFGLVKAIIGGGDDAPIRDPETGGIEAPANPSPAIPSTTTEASTPVAPIATETVKLEATGTVYLLVRQSNDKTELYRGTLGAGESTEISKSGPIEIMYTAGENLIINYKGERFKPSRSGTASSKLD